MEYKSITMKQMALEERPREKFLIHGIKQMTDAELLAIIIGSGNRELSAVDLARRMLIDSSNNLNTLSGLTIEDLKKRYKGIGNAKAISIAASFELGLRCKQADYQKIPHVKSSSDAYNVMISQLDGLPHEEFWILHLNRSNKLIYKQKLSQGGISGTIVDIKIAVKKAIEYLSSSIILCHNHPSGSSTPSSSDIDITHKMKDACKLLDIQVVDHIIITNENYYSFADEGIL